MAATMAPNPPAHNAATHIKGFNHMRTSSYNSVTSRPTSGNQLQQPQQLQSPQSQQPPVLRLSPPSRANNFRQPPHHAAQIRPLKSPLYVPAVLRPTEKPVRHSPPRINEHDSRPGDDSWAANVGSEEAAGSASAGPSSPWIQTRVATVTVDELLDIKGPVTGMPSTNHWKPDSAALTCNSRQCEARFGMLTRRHHCRRCGNIFCWQHSARRAPLDQHALFHPAGTPSRVCDRCYRCYADWETRRSSRTGSESSGSSGSIASSTGPIHIRAGSVGSLPSEASQEIEEHQENQEPQGDFRPKSFVTSIPNHWNWSTF